MPDTDVNPLPEIDNFTEDERLLARFIVGAIHSGGTMFEGRLHECIISRILLADLPPRGVWPWDLRLRDHDDASQRTRIEVRSGARSVKLEGGKSAHLWIFVRKASAPTQPPVSYCVAPDHRVRPLRASAKTRTLQRLEHEFGVVSADELTRAVATCSSDERTYRKESGESNAP